MDLLDIEAMLEDCNENIKNKKYLEISLPLYKLEYLLGIQKILTDNPNLLQSIIREQAWREMKQAQKTIQALVSLKDIIPNLTIESSLSILKDYIEDLEKKLKNKE